MLAKSTAPDPANPSGLGITRCTACGQPIEVVSPLCQDEHCGVCVHDLDRYDVLADELRRLVAPWLTACRARRIDDRTLAEVWDSVDCDLFQNERSVPA